MFEKLSITSVTTSIANNAYGLWQTAKQYFTVEPVPLSQTETKNHSVKFNFKQFVLLLGTMSVVGQRASMGLGFGVLLSQIPTAEAAFPAVIDLNNLTASTGVILQGRTAGDWAGFSVSGLDDINGDGMPDMLVGAWKADPFNRDRAGEAYILFGRNGNWPAIFDLNNINASTGVVLQGRAANDQTGWSVNTLGDINGDGIADMFVGAPNANPLNRVAAGEAYILFGRNGNWPAIFDLNNINASTGVILHGRVIRDYAGVSASGLDDINGDGMTDILVGAYGADPFMSRLDAGEAYILFSRNGSWPLTIDLNNLNSNTGVILQGRVVGDNAGLSVSRLGDINGDGIGDMLVGARYASPPGRTNAGEAYIIFGRNGSWPQTFDLNNLNLNTGVILQGRAENNYAGRFVSGLGDINGDGVVDMLIGGYGADPFNRTGAGEAYIIFGRNGSWPTTLDLNSLNASTGVVLQGRAVDDAAGYYVSSLGDVNGDGIADLLVGAPNADPLNRTGAGEAYIIFGRNGSWPAVFDLNRLNASTGIVLQGRAADDSLGIYGSALGDVNSDGIADMLVGAYLASPLNRAGAGEAYIIFGQRQATLVPQPAPAPVPSPLVSPPSPAPVLTSIFSNSIRSSTSPNTITLSIIVSSIPIEIQFGTSTTLTTNHLLITGNVPPSQVVYTVLGNNPGIVITVNGVVATQFTQADVEGQFVEIALQGVTCGDYSTDLQLEANVAGSNTSPQRVDVGLIFEGTTCANAGRLSAFSFCNANIGFWSQKREAKGEGRPEERHTYGSTLQH